MEFLLIMESLHAVFMDDAWSPEEVARIDAAEELVIAARRDDGTLRRALPIWVVVAGDAVYVRTWERRDTGWYGAALASGRARIEVPSLEVDVRVDDVGAGPDDVRAAIDAAYRAKYGRYGGSTDRMIGAEAAATTLRLTPKRVD